MSSNQGQKSRVPTFSSFKPKNEAPPSAKAPIPETTKDKESRQFKEPTSRSSRHGYGGRSDRKLSRHDRSPPPGRSRLDLPRRSPAAPTSEAPRGDSFVIDKSGDPLIRRYGGNSRYDVPAYRRFGRGRVLGADGFIRVEQLGSRDEFTLHGFYERCGSALNNGDRKHPLANSGRANAQVVRVRAEKAAAYTGAEDFLPLGSSSRKRKRPESDDDGASSIEEGPSYRSIHGKSKPHEFSDSDEEYGGDVVEPRGKGPDGSFSVMAVQLSERVRHHPRDIEAWLALVEHQDTLLHAEDRGSQRPTQAEIQSFADIKLSMLEKALSHCTSTEQRETLVLRIMTEGAKVWDAKALGKRWGDVVREHSSSFAIWKAYADYKQTNLSTLRYADIKLFYVNKVQQLKAVLNRQGIMHADQALYAQLIVVFTRLTRFVAESGYCELAAASWQAILELHFCRPASIGGETSNIDIMAAPPTFQVFWESEVARIGEESAKGWAAFETNSTEEPSGVKNSNNGTTLDTRDPFKAWAAAEQHRASHASIPARTMDEGAEDDPYRVVMYTDMEDFLFFVPDGALSLVQELLLSAFLVFHQLPPAPGSDGLSNLLIGDALLDTNGLIHPGINKRQDMIHAPETEGNFNKPLKFPQSHQRISPSTEVLFPVTNWFNYMEPVRALPNGGQFRLAFNVLKQLCRSHGRSDLATYHLALDICSPKTDGKKTAKALLKRFPTNIDLYIGYANYGFRAVNHDAGSNVISAALQLPNLSPEGKVRLSLAWACMALQVGDLNMGLSRVCLVSQESTYALTVPASPAVILKTRQTLASNFEYSTSQGNDMVASLYAKALVLLQYLTQQGGKEPRGERQGGIESAMASVTKCSNEFKSRGLAANAGHEQLLQLAAQLMYVHINHGPYRPAFLREHMASFLHFFPDNTMFLSLFAWKETRLSIDDRVRALLNNATLTRKQDCVTSRVFAIRHEMQSGGNAHSTRAAFEHALEDDSLPCRHNVGVWISYIRYCRETKELRPKAKEVFYRAIQQCPWSKQVFMEAFSTLVRDLDSSELQSVYRTMYEKGLRVHVDMDEFIEKWKTR